MQLADAAACLYLVGSACFFFAELGRDNLYYPPVLGLEYYDGNVKIISKTYFNNLIACAVFCLISGIASGTKFYSSSKTRFFVRWIDYFLTAPLMMMTIAAMCGIFDILLLMSIWIFQAGNIYLGAEVEYYGLKGDFRMSTYIVSWILALFPWIYVFVVLSNAPDFVYLVMFVLLILFMLFAVIHGLLLSRGPDYLPRAEFWYSIASLTAKLNLAWMMYNGTVSRNSDDVLMDTVYAFMTATALSGMTAGVILCLAKR